MKQFTHVIAQRSNRIFDGVAYSREIPAFCGYIGQSRGWTGRCNYLKLIGKCIELVYKLPSQSVQ